ncbi:amylo-alpha-1,6-glucosidase [Roseofilum casamattae]|uniref:Amylo-alpha-1,6-glucosidase n=1 Tax=Roseofilum casamattae BLCC-M143 TaxID=3022442 RepID=A0ABT7BSV2_9CYAN|nr:amylo-alpha-1,6-glucosidase [Roseofilum casamattae]MDJ1182150.1 amylo-alpha-1,6-glucosidase [Roseofilum casamattae BLCC-M143]
MAIEVGREICGDLALAESREWLATNGLGGYASGTIAQVLTRSYHGLLVAALQPPVRRTLLLAKLDETVCYNNTSYPLFTNRSTRGQIEGHGYRQIQSFRLEGTVPVWTFACGDALIEKRVWMQQRQNTTYIRYTILRSSGPLQLSLQAIANYRPHNTIQDNEDLEMTVESVSDGVKISANSESVPFYLFSSGAEFRRESQWMFGYDLSMERYRGDRDRDRHYHACTLEATLEFGESLTVVATTQANANLDGALGLRDRDRYEKRLLQRWRSTPYLTTHSTPDWIQQLILAANQFIVCRPLSNGVRGKTVIAGYPWFTDWGRDTTISLSGLTIATGQFDIGKRILQTFARYVDRGMLPNVFPNDGETPAYNTVDATLWYFEAISQYYKATRDRAFVAELFPILAEIIDWHCRGTRYQIHRDPEDGLLFAGEEGTQLTWMDAKYKGWTVTPRQGKPVEVNALWYNALRIMAEFARKLGKADESYVRLANEAARGFQRFWNSELNGCYDVLDTAKGSDRAVRPNQIFAVSLSHSPLTLTQQQGVVDTCSRELLTSYGLRSLSPKDPQYIGRYGGDLAHRDGAYHQGTTWGWLLGSFAIAHFKAYHRPAIALSFLSPMADCLMTHGMGSISEIFDGDAPFTPRGCIAQAWSVAETLRAWQTISSHL